MINENKNRNLVAAITGASSGIGYELAKVFAKNGYDLIVNAEDGGIVTAAQEFRQYGTNVKVVQADLAEEEGVQSFCEQLSGASLDTLVLNAGVGVGGEFISTSLERELKMIDLNVGSVVRLTKFILPQFVSEGRGKILYTSSIAGEMPGPYYAVYAATKAFVQSFAEAIRHEVKDKGVTITSLQPGPTDTEFFARADMVDTKAGQGKKDDPAQVAQDGFDALMAGKDHVVAGSMMNAVQATMGKIIPETLGAKMQGDSAKPNSLKH